MKLFDQRSKTFIEKLIENTYINQNVLLDSLMITKPQLDYVIEKVNDLLVEVDLPTIFVNGTNLILPKESRSYFLDLFSSTDLLEKYELNGNERKKYIFLMLVYYVGDYLSVNHFLEALKVGKTTFISDVKKLENDLIKEDLTIVYSRKNGYQLQGNEGSIRNYLMKQILIDFGTDDNSFIYQFFLWNEKIETKETIFEMTRKYLKKYSLDLVENRLNEFCYTFLILLPRLNKTWEEFYNKYNFQTFYKMEEYAFAKDLLSEFSIENEYSELFVCCWLLGNAVGNPNIITGDYSIVKELVEKIVQRFERLSGVCFNDRDKVIKQLYSHFRPTYYRLFFNLPIVNVLHDKIVQSYPDLYQLVKKTMMPIGDLLEIEIPKDEVSFLTIHFVPLVKNYENYHVRQKVGVVVCPNGIGSSLIVYNELKTIFPDLILLGPIEMQELNKFQRKFDMIFTTVPNIRLYSFKKPVYVASPIMTDEERYELVNVVNTKKSTNPGKYVNIAQLLKIIENNTKITDYSKLEKELYKFLTDELEEVESIDNPVQYVNSEVNLSSLVKEDYIQLNLDVKGWEEAFYLAALPMLNDQVITRRYIDEIIKLTRKEGPYMVITNRVALPHARPELGAKKLGLGITVLNNEISVLGKEKVKYIFTLSALDNTQHLTAISELVHLLDKPDFFEMLDTSTTPKDVHQWIINYFENS